MVILLYDPVENRRNVMSMFNLMDDAGARYYLLRPIDLKQDVKSIDIVVPEEDVNNLVNHIMALGLKATFTRSIAENNIAIVVNDMMIDIKTKVCFFASKFYAFDKEPPFSTVTELDGGILVPDVSPDRLFTFWSLHLFLDKKNPKDSSSYHLFERYFSKTWPRMLNNNYCREWYAMVWGGYMDQAIDQMRAFMSNEFSHDDADNEFLKNLALSRNSRIHLTYYIEKIKYGIIRRIKRDLFKPIAAYS
jgi:hypothetical protein